MTPLTYAEARHAVASIVDTDLAVRRQRMALRMAQARISLTEGQRETLERHQAFWRAVEATRAADAVVERARMKA